jgi:chromosome segregation ATPase
MAELTAALNQVRKENEGTVGSVLRAIEDESADARGEIARAQSLLESLQQQKQDLTQRIRTASEITLKATGIAVGLRAEVSRNRTEPTRVNKQLESVKSALATAQAEASRLEGDIEALAKGAAERKAATDQIQAVRAGMSKRLTIYRTDLAARERELNGLERSLRGEKVQFKDLLERRLFIETDVGSAESALKAAERAKTATEAAYERAKRDVRVRVDRTNNLRAELPGIREALARVQVEAQALTKQAAGAAAESEQLRTQTEALRQSFGEAGGVERKLREELVALTADCRALERERDYWAKEELLVNKHITALRAQKDNKRRETMKIEASARQALEQGKSKELQLLDQSKRAAELAKKLQELTVLYEAAKAERNNYAISIQSTQQSIAEMRQRLKILKNELDILKNETLAKDRGLAKEKLAAAQSASLRDQLRAEANKGSLIYKERQAIMESRIVGIDKLNSIVSRLEKEMIVLKRRYETAVETRNFTGIQLIDRNDELCILYEKSNIHEKTLGDGERQLAVLSDELRSLRIHAKELERQLYLARSRFADTPKTAERILELQRSLVQARQIVERLSLELESPTAMADKWVKLEGTEPSDDLLRAKADALTKRLDLARAELLDRDLALEDVTAAVDRLKEALAGPGGQQEPSNTGAVQARLLADVQTRLRELTKKLMAVVSELSMYQAASIKLAGETTRAHEALATAETKVAQGEAPTNLAASKWQAIERQERQQLARSQGARLPGDGPAFFVLDNGTKTTAEPRPNAYIPRTGDEDVAPIGSTTMGSLGPSAPASLAGLIGLPKPYGAFPPIKPTVCQHIIDLMFQACFFSLWFAHVFLVLLTSILLRLQEPGANIRFYKPEVEAKTGER